MEKMPYISVKKLRKTFGKIIANNNINLDIYGGEIHALLGENGAGKSTLMNMLSGIYTPDSGSIFIEGKEVKFSSPKSAINHGIGMIYQHFRLVEEMNALENILLGQKKGLWVNHNKEIKKIEELIEQFQLTVNLKKLVKDMSVSERQNLEILKVLYRGAKTLILDEPTTVFTDEDTKKLFNIMRKMKEKGCAIIFISHKMDEVMEISDKITVLRKGETIKTLEKSNTNPKELTSVMVGKAVDLSIERDRVLQGDVILEVKDLSIENNEAIKVLKNITFNLRSGEVLGVAGIAGSGQKELCEGISGIQKIKSGTITIEGENIVGKSPREIINKGISMSFIPEDRLGMGLVASMGMVENLLLKDYHRQKGFILNRAGVTEKSKELLKQFQIKTPHIHYPIKNLSGGNIQKVLVGRELSAKPKVLIMAYPVRGLDINTCYNIYNLINEQKKKGTGILYFGEDLDVLIKLCDRIMVICNGEVMGILNSEEATRERLGMMMVGKSEDMEEKKC
jgi:ABC-type uncharacterized transport system ATPase subunit